MDHQTALVALGQQALTGIEAPELLRAALATVRETLGADWVEVRERVGTDSLVLRARSGGDGDPSRAGPAWETVEGRAPAGLEPVAFEDLTTETEASLPPHLRPAGARGAVCVQIAGPDGPWGVLSAFFRAPRRQSPEELLFLGAVALLVSTALQRLARESALRVAEARLRRLVDANLIGVMVGALEGEVSQANDELLRLVGYTRAELETGALRWDRLTPPEWRAQDEQALAELRERGQCTPYEKEYLRGDGTRVPVVVGGALLEGAPEQCVAFALDISHHKAAEQATREREEWTHLLVNAFPDQALFTVDPQGRVTSWNDGAARLLGYPAEEILGEHFARLFTPEDRARGLPEAELRQAAAEGRFQAEGPRVRKDGATLPIAVTTSCLRGPGGEVRGFAKILRDLSERAEARRRLEETEQQLRHVQKLEAVGRLAGGVAHDFNNLMTVVNGYSERLLGQLRADDPLRREVQEIHRAGQRAAALTRQLLAFSRRQMLQPQVLDAGHVLRELDGMLRRLIGEDIDLVTAAAPGLWRIKVDRGQLEQVIVNLAVNARDAMPDGGQLTIEAHNVDLDAAYAATHAEVAPGPHVMIAVTDTGVGMGPEVRRRLFEPFFTTKSPGKGTGLGLSTAYGIVKQSGGHIWVYSEPGQGTTFKLYFPRCEEALSPGTTALRREASLRGDETVLLVEDDDLVRELAETILREHGYTVLVAPDPLQALLLAEGHQGPIHLLLTDVVMPHMSGRQLFERLSPGRPDMRVLYMSGYTENAVVHRGVVDPGTAFLQKPFGPGSLTKAVREVLRPR